MSALVPDVHTGVTAAAVQVMQTGAARHHGQVPRRLALRLALTNYVGARTFQPVLDGSDDAGATWYTAIFSGAAQNANGTFWERVPEAALVHTSYRVRVVVAAGAAGDSADVILVHHAVLEA